MTRRRAMTFVLFKAAMIGFMSQGVIVYLQRLIGVDLLIPPHVVLIYLAGILVFLDRKLLRVIFFSRKEKWLIILVIITASIAAWNEITTHERIVDIKSPFQILTGILIFYISFLIVQYERQLRSFIRIVFITAAISGSIAFCELVSGISVPWAMVDRIHIQSGFGGQGLEWYPISFGYSILAGVALAIAYSKSPKTTYGYPGRVYCTITILCGSLGLIGSGSRSAILGLVVSILLIHSLKRLSILRVCTLIFFILPFCSAIVLVAFGIIGKKEVTTDARILSTHIVYLPVVAANPFGVYSNYLEDSFIVIESHETTGIEIPNHIFELGASISPHNGVLTAGMRYGWIGIITLLSLYTCSLYYGIHYARVRCLPFHIRHFTIAVTAAILAIFVHMQFHNMSLLSGDMRNWMPIGLLFGAIYKMRTYVWITKHNCLQL
jgi:hypothetical protein